MELEATPTWTPESYDISRVPSLLSVLKTSPYSGENDNFPRCGKWCADGLTVLVQTESGTFQRFDVPSQENTTRECAQEQTPLKEFRQAAPILDFMWYPTASPNDAASFCFVASVRECPVKLLDASDGRLRASYKIVDHRERFIAPHSLAFNLTAHKLYCGFEDAIEIFDLSRPGEGTRMPTTPSKKSKDGLKGIISSLAFSSSYTSDESFYAAGSFTPTPHNIAMFSDAQTEPLMYVGGGPRAGVTQLRFNPTRPHILYAGYRGHASDKIYSWDIRSNVGSPLEIFKKSSVEGSTLRSNQRMHFDIDVVGRLLSAGDHDGSISLFELNSTDTLEHNDLTSPVSEDPVDDTEPKISLPQLRYQAHHDAVGSVSFHPFKPSILSASGSRHFVGRDEGSTDSDLGSESESDSSNDGGQKVPQTSTQRRRGRPRPVAVDSTMKIWDLSVRDV